MPGSVLKDASESLPSPPNDVIAVKYYMFTHAGSETMNKKNIDIIDDDDDDDDDDDGDHGFNHCDIKSDHYRLQTKNIKN